MDIVKFSIEKPVTVIVGVILVVMFGMISLNKMPYQLTPSVIEPEITVSTSWAGATPYEIERDVIEEQEKTLKGIPGLIEMESSSQNGRGSITLRFKIGTSSDDALLRVSNKLNEVRRYPENVDRPVINATGAATSPVIWMILKSKEGNPESINGYRSFFEDNVRQYLERVDGVADLFIGGGTFDEMHVTLSPTKLAAYGLTISDMIDALQRENVNISAGNMEMGRRDYRIRTVAELKSTEEIKAVVIRSTGQRRITVGDIADVKRGYEKKSVAMIHNGNNGMAVGIKPEPGTNIITMTNAVEEVVNWLNEGKLKEEGIFLDWAYDQRSYINGAINLVKRNILIGGFLAIIVLLIFLRSLSATVIVAMAIPISIIGTFIFMNAAGRNLNVVSLAGIAFAVGMLVDNAIVVLENIDRHRKMGKSPFESAYDGTREVWGAIFASTITTVAVFLPIIFIEEEAGQLFKDIAIAVTFAVILSLFVSVSVIPMFSKYLFALSSRKTLSEDNIITKVGHRLVAILMSMIQFTIRDWKTRTATILILTSTTILLAWALFPKMEYLPQGNRNLIINFMVPPPGLSYKERMEIGQNIFKAADPYIGQDHEGIPGIKDMFYVGAEWVMLFGAISLHDQRAREMIPIFQPILNNIPGVIGFSSQAGIFQTRLGRGRSIDVDISGNDLNKILSVAGAMFGMIMKEMPGRPPRPIPSLEILYPEIKIIPHRDRIKASGMSASDLGITLDVLMDGRKVGEYKEEGEKKIDLILKASADDISSPEALYHTSIVTPEGKIVPISSLSRLERTSGIKEIRHLERQRTVTLQVTPPLTTPLQEAMEIIESRIIAPLKAKGMTKGLEVRMSGAADKLVETTEAMKWNFIIAAIIIYLLMSALFGNFFYPLIIMFTVPLAAAGGILGIRIVNIFTSQPLDVLTMLGFIILVGVVVNNAILIVHQSLNNVRFNGMDYNKAIFESTRSRLRPIYMSAATSIFGMLPLVIAPGPGSELYRGLGSVILGGLALSTIFTIFVIPALLMFFIKMEKPKG